MKNAEAADHHYERMRMVGQGLASWAMEGAEPDRETKADMIEFALCNLTADEVVRRTRARYGLVT